MNRGSKADPEFDKGFAEETSLSASFLSTKGCLLRAEGILFFIGKVALCLAFSRLVGTGISLQKEIHYAKCSYP
jgi:hypothetical protein